MNANQQKNEPGHKHDAGKTRLDLLPFDAVHEIAEVLTFGANKYADRNWEKGMSWGRCIGALLRHTFAFARGEERDPETGLSHMAHAGCCVLFLLSYQLRGAGTDDRAPALVSRYRDRPAVIGANPAAPPPAQPGTVPGVITRRICDCAAGIKADGVHAVPTLRYCECPPTRVIRTVE